MSGDGMTPASGGAAQLRRVRAELAATSDDKLLRVLAMVEGAADAARGAAEPLLQPLRGRLAVLRPPRPLRFARLLFLPLDKLIVPPASWQPGALAVPRHALVPMADAVARAMGPAVEEVRLAIAGRTTADTASVDAAGAVAWPAAARLLPGLAVPEDWALTGLPGPAFAPLAGLVAHGLRDAVAVMALCGAVARGMDLNEAALGRVLDGAAARGPDAWRVVTALLVLRLGEHPAVLRALTAGQRLADARLRAATEQAVDAALGQLAARSEQLSGWDEAGAAQEELGRIGDMLDRIEASGAGPERRQRIGALRARLDAACRAWVGEELAEGVTAPLRALAGSPDAPGGEAMPALEAAARGMRLVEAAGRRFGGGEQYDRMLRTARREIMALPVGGGVSAVDRARMIELLAGPDEAAALLG